MLKKVKCSKFELLKFFKKRGMVENWEISQKYNLDLKGVTIKLIRLRAQGLVKDFGKGHWVLTEDGIRRLRLYGERQEKR
jgi:predicted transcriptional regulator